MQAAAGPRHGVEKLLALVLMTFIAMDVLPIVPAYASELRLKELHPFLPVVNLRPLAEARYRNAEGLADELPAAVLVIAEGVPVPSGAADGLESAVGQPTTAQMAPMTTYTGTLTVNRNQPGPSMTQSRVAIFAVASLCVACQATATPTPAAIPTSTPPAILGATSMPTPGPLPAFPGAEGWGAESVGGRGGQVIEVTNLENAGPGSLRACAQEASGPRICVFRVAGEIVLTGSRLKIQSPYLTIAGQTAPGGGITLRGGDESVRPIMQFEDGVHDVIVRYLTIRPGQGYGDRDAVTFRSGNDIILDHISVEWATDEAIALNPNTGETVSDVSIQRSIVAETLRPHSTAMLLNGEDPLFQVTLHHNLFAHNGHRNPRVRSATQVEFTNNVVYNWHGRVGETVAEVVVDFSGNYLLAGPWSDEDDIILHEHIDPSQPEVLYTAPSIYAAGNVAIPYQPDPDADNWNLFRYHYALSGRLPDSWRRANPSPARIPVSLDTAQGAYDSVLADVGNNARLDGRGAWLERVDEVDQDLLSDVIDGTGPDQDSEIDHHDDFGGYPGIDLGSAYTDSDHDGMADEWERLYCLDPNTPSDGPTDADEDGYTNLEEFLNGTQPIFDGTCSS